MKRRVVEQGGLTLMVSLPRSWAKRFSLKKGDEIDITEVGNNLILSSGYKPEHKKKKIHIKSKDEFMFRLIHGPYRQGFDELEISFEEPEILSLIKQRVDQLLGFEIVEEGEKYVIIQMVAKGMEDEFDKIINRLLLMIKNSLSEVYNTVKYKKSTRLDELIDMEKTNNKLTAFCERILNTKGHKDYKKTNFYYVFVWTLEQIGDELRDLAKILKKSDLGKLGNLIAPLEKVSKLSESFNKLVSKNDMPSAVSLRTNQNELGNVIEKLKLKDKSEIEIIFHIKNIADRFKDLSISMI